MIVIRCLGKVEVKVSQPQDEQQANSASVYLAVLSAIS